MRHMPAWTTRALRVATVAIAVLSWAPTSARAQVFVAGSVGSTFGGDVSGCQSLTNCETRRVTYGGSLGYLWSLLGWEGEVAHTPQFFGESAESDANGVTTVMMNLLVAPSFGPVRPYGVLGLGSIRTTAEFNLGNAVKFEDTDTGWAFGAGVMVFPSDYIGVRGDIRRIRGTSDLSIGALSIAGADRDFSRGSVSLVVRF